MRILVGLTLLFLTFGLAAWWQRRTLNDMRLQREAASGTSLEEERLPGWGELLIGTPSGADPVERTQSPAESEPGTEDMEERSRAAGGHPGAPQALPTQPPPAFPPPYELRIRSGQRLWSLLQRHYGHVGPELVQEIADYNGLADADMIEVDQLLLLPSEEELALLRDPGR